MSDKQPIDYARPWTENVLVRERHRRRVVTFILASIFAVFIGFGWTKTQNDPTWLIGGSWLGNPISINSDQGRIQFNGPERISKHDPNWRADKHKPFGNRTIGIEISGYDSPGFRKWDVVIRYRTLFILAVILWISQFVRLIRS